MVKNDENELANSMQKQLEAQELPKAEHLVKAADYLHSAMDLLEQSGLVNQSNKVFNILSKIAQETKDLKPEEMVKNLEDHGTMLELDDGEDLLEADVGNDLEVFDKDTDKDFEDE